MFDAPVGPDLMTKKQFAADWLREMIVSGEFPPGHRIRQREAAGMLAVSATPAREAILQLVTEGYLESIPHVGVRVAELSDEHRDEVSELRTLLEGQLACVAAESITDDQLASLQRLHTAFGDAVRRFDSQEARRTNYHFHRLIWRFSGRLVTQHIVQALWARVPWQTLDDIEGRGHQSVEEHAQLLDALAARDPEAAQRAAAAHIASSTAYMLATRSSA